MLKSSTVKLRAPAPKPALGRKYRVGASGTNIYGLKMPAKPARRAKKAFKPDERFVCPFSVGQIIQHSKRPTINYMLMAEPVQVRRKAYWYSNKSIAWKLKLFTIRGGKLGGRLRTRTMSRRLIKDYQVVSDVELSSDFTPDLLVAPPTFSEENDSSNLLTEELVVSCEGDNG